jgi:cell division protein FtsN
MSRDYKPTAKSGASKKSGSPMLTGVVIGTFIGLAIALAVAMFIKGSPSPFVERKPQPVASEKTGPAPTPPVTAPPSDKPKAPEKPRFEFYDILPGNEERVTEKEIKQQAPEITAKSQYFLQAGAFQKEADADNLKAKLALTGVEASIQTVTLPEKGIWHRVRIGPYNNVDDVNRARTTLSQNGVASTLVKVRDQAPAR